MIEQLKYFEQDAEVERGSVKEKVNINFNFLNDCQGLCQIPQAELDRYPNYKQNPGWAGIN